MSFIWSSLLYSLLSVPLLIWAYQRIQKRKREAAAHYGNFGIMRDSSGRAPARRLLPTILFLIGVVILIFSLARPQAALRLPRIEGVVVLAFDISGSMAADDANPTRMEAAKAAALNFVNRQPANIRIGVTAFSDSGVTVQTPTDKRAEIVDTIQRLAPRRGTSVGNGILVALNTVAVDAGDPPFLQTSNVLNGAQPPPNFSLLPGASPQGWYPHAAIILFSDGENNQEPDPIIVADLAANLGIRVYTVGVGSVAGAALTIDGFTVHTQLDEPMLQAVANAAGGAYYNAGDENQLREIYSALRPKLIIRAEESELTSLFAGIAMLFFFTGGALSLLWFGRAP
ncbi:MAG: hypothetical protein B6D38_07495 [Anaerolineae bacterium UTCFX1]|jgi:Ca-activated chloride channel family protein|nr:MAG: hypothetical protein B6D38_07495 [Anaerolineae bacterium UTCFX1]